jgi:hypothetical protein
VNKQENIVPSLNLAPRLKCPLSLWNPLDYFRLFYWVFFFPQAFSWYINTFGKSGAQTPGNVKTIELLRQDPVQRKLVIQALIVLLITVSIAALGLTLPGWKINWQILVAGAALGMVSGGIVGKVFGIAFGVPFGLTFGFTFGIMGNIIEIAFHSTFNQNNISDLGAVLGTALGAAAGVALNAADSVKSGVDDDVMKGITGGMFFMVVGGFFFVMAAVIPSIAATATTNILSRNLMNTAFFSIGLGASFCLFFSRLTEYFPFALFAALHRFIFKKRRGTQAGRVIFLPLPGVRKQLERELESDWENGIDNANQILGYTLQYIPVVKAVKNILERSSNDTMLLRISTLVDRTIDWNLIRFCSSSLNKQFRQKIIEGFLFLFLRKKNDLVRLQIDTPARAACAGFWYWHSQEPAEAVQAFARVQDQRHGIELYYIAEALKQWFEINNDDKYKNNVGGIVEWEYKTQKLKKLPDPELRSGTLAMLRKLQAVSTDVNAAIKALSPFKRSQIAKNAKAELNRLTAEGEEICTNPEWPTIKEIALNWLEILDNSEWEFPGEELKKPVENPYEGSAGLPVTGTTFRGREDIIKKIEEHWATDKNMSTLILYGQRRIGKTSILKNMARRTGSDILLVYISMQKVGKVNHTGQLLYRFAEAIASTAMERGLPIGSSLNETGYTDMYKGIRSLSHLLDKLAPHMTGQKRMVLAIDEFELIQEKIEYKQIDAEILPYLRDMVQEYSWLGMIFAGLHIIEEMGRHYKEAFFGQARYVPVSFLKRAVALALIAHPKPPRIALEYSKDLLDEFYRLTAGQPYLIQCLCGELVSHWNERFEREGEETPRTLMLADLSHVITSDFFGSAEYYFEGVWDNITEEERVLMRIIAERQQGTWTLDELAETAKIQPSFEKFSTLKETIDLLKRHDVILEEGGRVRFSGELMRRWVAEEKTS